MRSCIPLALKGHLHSISGTGWYIKGYKFFSILNALSVAMGTRFRYHLPCALAILTRCLRLHLPKRSTDNTRSSTRSVTYGASTFPIRLCSSLSVTRATSHFLLDLDLLGYTLGYIT